MESISHGSVHAFANPAAGSADAALAVLRADPRVRLQEISPSQLRRAIRIALDRGATTIVVAGGDGTISTAASCLAGSQAALCILRSGTLNHFARRIGVPVDPGEALELAFRGRTSKVDVGRVNGRLFLNTSVVGLYVDYVKRRERLRERVGKAPASVAAAVRSFFTLRDERVSLEIGEAHRAYKSVLFFAAVGEREFRVPVLGELKDSGRRGLHVVAMEPKSRWRLLATVVRMATRGVRVWPAGDQPESFVVTQCRLHLPRRLVSVALDGEIMTMKTPLSYRFERDALAVRVPASAHIVRSE